MPSCMHSIFLLTFPFKQSDLMLGANFIAASIAPLWGWDKFTGFTAWTYIPRNRNFCVQIQIHL